VADGGGAMAWQICWVAVIEIDRKRIWRMKRKHIVIYRIVSFSPEFSHNPGLKWI
jgi:hypothetical protein